MKKILCLVFVLPVLAGVQLHTDKKCDFNLEINEDWEEKLTDKNFPFDFIEKKSFPVEYDTTEMDKEKIAPLKIMTNVFIFKTTGEDAKEIQLSEYIFPTPCAAYEDFKHSLTYFQSDAPRYEYNTRPWTSLVQGNKVFAISADSGEEKLMEKFREAFSEILLVNPAQKESVFVRRTNARAVLK